jgi:atypical dual specificity phosphatase
VRAVVSMNEDFELKYWVTTRTEWQRMNINYLQLNTADILHAPTQDKLTTGVKFINQFDGTQYSVYVHCKAGRTRSATLVACYLMQVCLHVFLFTYLFYFIFLINLIVKY